MKLEEKNKAQELRRLGKSYNEIKELINVSKSSLSRWLDDIDLTKDQLARLLKGREISRYAAGRAKHANKLATISQIKERAKIESLKLMSNPLFLVGLSLYWAEGDKHMQERVKFTNSDPDMIAIIMKWFREICNVPENKFRIALHIHTLHSNNNLINYWSKITKVPKNQFNKTFVKPTSLKQRRNILYNGTCAIIVNDRNLFRKIIGWQIGTLDKFEIKSLRSSTDRTRAF